NRYKLITNVRSSLMAVNIHITIIELNALHTKRQNLFQELDAVIHLLMEAKHWGLRKSRNATSLNSRFKSLDTLKVKIISVKIGRASCRERAQISVSAFLLNRSSDLALWPSTYISPLSNSTPCIRKDRISSKSLMRLSICLWKPSIGDRERVEMPQASIAGLRASIRSKSK